MTEDTKALPKGLQLYKAGESLEAAGSKAGEVHLLFTRGNVELVRTHVKAGKHITLVPSRLIKTRPHWKFTFVLSGFVALRPFYWVYSESDRGITWLLIVLSNQLSL